MPFDPRRRLGRGLYQLRRPDIPAAPQFWGRLEAELRRRPNPRLGPLEGAGDWWRPAIRALRSVGRVVVHGGLAAALTLVMLTTEARRPISGPMVAPPAPSPPVALDPVPPPQWFPTSDQPTTERPAGEHDVRFRWIRRGGVLVEAVRVPVGASVAAPPAGLLPS